MEKISMNVLYSEQDDRKTSKPDISISKREYEGCQKSTYRLFIMNPCLGMLAKMTTCIFYNRIVR